MRGLTGQWGRGFEYDGFMAEKGGRDGVTSGLPLHRMGI